LISLDKLNKGDKAVIKDLITEEIPLTLLEMGCLPGNEITIIGLASKKGPIYLKIDESHVSIDSVTASQVLVELIK
jgi:ferrous iron transport protein A|tara:strand:- start:2420 stop:2647 length:228 start_codon:yes stop_codon:yes gene_type:complete